jgi:molybdate transport system substrate-binding protein
MLVCVGTAGFAAAADIRVYTTGAPAPAAKTIAANFAKDTGHQVTFTVGQPAVIEADLARGDKADLVILPSPAVAALNGSGVLRSGSAVAIARVGIGVVVRAGAKPPDISNAAAIRKLLLDARSIVYPDPSEPGGGSAGRAIAHMIEQLGLTDTVRPKLTLSSAIGGGVALVASGAAEVGIFNISEIMPIKGAALVGPLPSELQNYIVFSAAIPAANAAPEAAAAFIKRLADPATRQDWLNAGLEPVAAGH